MLVLHIVAGSLALIAGMTALFARKGATWHRRSGTVFVLAMLVMPSSGAVMAMLKPEPLSALAGVLTFYLVCTGVLALRGPHGPSRATTAVFLLVAAAVAVGAFAFGLEMRAAARNAAAPVYFSFAGIALFCALSDARLLRAGALHGAPRLARHIARMGLALLIANASFFLGQAKLLPPPLRNVALLSIPPLLVLLTTLFWLARVYLTRRPASPQRSRDATMPRPGVSAGAVSMPRPAPPAPAHSRSRSVRA